ncbi:MAG: type II toxin-antitoxin system VapC family toxin [Anaerolineae bacterium]
MSAIEERVPTIVIDASVAVWAVLPVVAASDVTAQFAEWRKHGSRIVAPDHWVAECVSAIRRTVYRRIVSDAEGRVAIQDLFALDVEIVPTTERQSLAALEWAERLGQARAYDGLYCALAEELKAEFWTADQRLARAAQQRNAVWVRWIGATP